MSEALSTTIFFLTLRELRKCGLSWTRETCWSSQLLQVLDRSGILLRLTVLQEEVSLYYRLLLREQTFQRNRGEDG